MATQPFAVTVVSQNSWNTDGSAIVEARCDHRHRTLTGAHRCFSHLTRKLPDGMYLAKWFRAEVRHLDGSPLAEEEADALLDLKIAES